MAPFARRVDEAVLGDEASQNDHSPLSEASRTARTTQRGEMPSKTRPICHETRREAIMLGLLSGFCCASVDRFEKSVCPPFPR